MFNKTAYKGQFKKRKVFICCYLCFTEKHLIFFGNETIKTEIFDFLTSRKVQTFHHMSRNTQKVFHHAAKEILENKNKKANRKIILFPSLTTAHEGPKEQISAKKLQEK